VKHVINAGILEVGDLEDYFGPAVKFRDTEGREFAIGMSEDTARSLAPLLYRNFTITIEAVDDPQAKGGAR